MTKEVNKALAEGIKKRTIRRGYYRRIRYFRIEIKRFSKGFRKTEPKRCLKCAYAKCKCEGVAA